MDTYKEVDKRFDEKWPFNGYTEAREQVKSFFHQELDKAVKAEREQIKVRIGWLRQWLNEERIKDVDKFVTNEQIENWLFEERT